MMSLRYKSGERYREGNTNTFSGVQSAAWRVFPVHIAAALVCFGQPLYSTLQATELGLI